MIEDFKVTIWYTAPTALRMLMSAGDDIVENMTCHRYVRFYQ